MSFLSTRICTLPIIENEIIRLSYDYAIWKSSDNDELIRQLYFNQCACEIKEMTEHFQPKNKTSLQFQTDNFYPCILQVLECDYLDWLNATHFEPMTQIYQASDLVFVGFDIMDFDFISIGSHGISAMTENDLISLNQFGLYKDMNTAKKYLYKNQQAIPEHAWKIVKIFINKQTYFRFKNHSFENFD